MTEITQQICELAILNVCETNHGPPQDVDGACPLSREFLGAGVEGLEAA